MDYVKIGGRAWDVLVTEISESFSILYSENTGRTMSEGARMTLDPLGTFFNHKVTFARKKGFEREFDALFDFVSTPNFDGIDVEIVHNQTTLKYMAYISQGERQLKRIDKNTGKVYWDALSLNIVPMEAQVLPL
jgi:hypothetical protein